MEGNALESPVNPSVPNITQLLLLLLFWRNTNWNNYGAFCIWVTALLTRSLPNSIKQHLGNFVSGDKHKLISFTTAVERWVKKTMYHSLFSKSCSNHIPPFLATTLSWHMLYITSTQPSNTECLRWFSFSCVSPTGFSSLSKCTYCSIDLFPYFFHNFTRTLKKNSIKCTEAITFFTGYCKSCLLSWSLMDK